jgi:hypothetical protein
MAMETLSPHQPPESKSASTRIIIALVVAVAVGLVAFYFSRSAMRPASTAAPSEQAAVLGPEERAYTATVGVDHLAVSRAENFLHQEVTTVSGDIINGGNRSLASVELTIEFSDDLNQIAQRETRALFGPPGPPISPGDHREFEISFDHISSSWNMRQPVVKVSALQFEPLK